MEDVFTSLEALVSNSQPERWDVSYMFGLSLKSNYMGVLVFAPKIDEFEVGNFNLHVVNKHGNNYLIKQNETTFLGEKNLLSLPNIAPHKMPRHLNLPPCLQSIL